MPELPDVTIYRERLAAKIGGDNLQGIRLTSPFLLRTVDPPASALVGKKVTEVGRIGKRIVLGFEGELFAIIHLMIAGRLRWRKPGAVIPRGNGVAAFDFTDGSVLFTEAGKKKRASLHIVRGREELETFDRGGIEVLDSTLESFSAALRSENHTLKRALTDQHVLSGIGNAYSDEILHRAKLSPFKQTQTLDDNELEQLHTATLAVMNEWTTLLRAEVGDGFPDKVTAFHKQMAVHGRHKQPCPECGAPVQRIVYAQNESNYCAKCQTGGKVLADRSLSRLLKSNWPRTLEELEERKL